MIFTSCRIVSLVTGKNGLHVLNLVAVTEPRNESGRLTTQPEMEEDLASPKLKEEFAFWRNVLTINIFV